MKIWKLRADVDRYANFTTNPMISYEEMQTFDGRSHASGWKPMELECIDERPLPMGDAVGFDFGALMSERARQMFVELGTDNVEFLPLRYGDETYYMMNVLGTVDCLDREKSKCLYSPTNKDRILIVHEYHFHENLIGDHKVFRLKDTPYVGPYVTEETVSAIRASGLTGFCFELVWDGKSVGKRKITIDGVLAVEY